MQVSVTGKKFDVGSSLREYVEDNIDKSVNKYFDNAIDASVVFSKEKHLICVDILVNEGTGNGVVIKGQAKENEPYVSFDSALARIEKQLRRYKRKLKNRKGRKPMDEIFGPVYDAKKYVLSDEGEETEEQEDNPLIIAEKQTKIETLTVSDAVMRMNLANLPALMFVNKKSGGINVVYRRLDGNISWVDSPLKAA